MSLMKTTRTMAAALALAGLSACGNDDVTSPVPPPPGPGVAGTYTAGNMWLVQFERLSDSTRGSYTCAGSLTISQAPSSSALSGFAVVGSPCPPVSFNLTGTIQADGTLTLTGDGPRPVSCESQTATYSGQFSNGSLLSARASVTLNCSGEVQGRHRFDYIVTGRRNN